jgi:hypothetical protein
MSVAYSGWVCCEEFIKISKLINQLSIASSLSQSLWNYKRTLFHLVAIMLKTGAI